MQNIFAKISRKGNKSSNDSVNKLLSNLMWVLNIGQIMLRWRNEIREFCSFHIDCSNKLYNASHILSFVSYIHVYNSQRYFAFIKISQVSTNNICFFFFLSQNDWLNYFRSNNVVFKLVQKYFKKFNFIFVLHENFDCTKLLNYIFTRNHQINEEQHSLI